ncbi:hypothetical protein YT1_4388 [Rhodococcus ruber]|nr:hypothetical protein YT1_4388 [Rhodococcus ruber]
MGGAHRYGIGRHRSAPSRRCRWDERSSTPDGGADLGARLGHVGTAHREVSRPPGRPRTNGPPSGRTPSVPLTPPPSMTSMPVSGAALTRFGGHDDAERTPHHTPR